MSGINNQLVREFRNPSSKYRGAPFWAWNGKLDPKELCRQVRLMHRMGLGGFFMHSRVGLDTPYLSDEWFDCIRACIDEAEKLDMQAWLYDEDRWPSGAAGGLVTKDPKFRRRSLVMEELKSPAHLKWHAETLGAFTVRVRGATATNVREIPRGKRPGNLAAGESILLFSVRTDRCTSWYNGYTYLDTMSRRAVREFITVTHEAYRRHVGKDFGRRVPGIFTDEPNYGTVSLDRGGTICLPWTPKLPAVFRRRYGYNITAHLCELFFDVGTSEVSRARYHYYDCITHLFVDAFSRQIGRWCDKNGIQHTGHVLAEDTLSAQTRVVGSCMRFYEHMQAPGMDLLTEHWRIYDTAKQVSSAARQFGRKWRLTETYGCTGWDFPFAGHKALGDWQAALGINLRCQHLSWYTMEGQAKRDYPAGIFYQSPWWQLYGKVEDYFARINAVMTRGAEVRDLLVIHPNESMWTMTRIGWPDIPQVQAYDRMLVALRDSLLGENIDFDYGDEEILARRGKAGRKDGKPVLRVGKAAYRAAIVPPLKTIRSTTLALLRKFRAAGGAVVFAGKVAEYVDAAASGAAKDLAAICKRAPAKGTKLARAVEPMTRRVSIADSKGAEITPALHLLREDRDAFYLFICNTGHKPHQLRPTTNDPTMVRDRKVAFPDVRIRGFSRCAGNPLELDPDTGEIFTASAKAGNGGWEVRTSLPPLASGLFVFPKTKDTKTYPPRKELKDVRKTTISTTKTKWDIILSESNVLVLDRPRYRIGSAPWKNPRDILQVDFAVRDALGVQHRGGQMVQPWARKQPARPARTTVTLAYSFGVKAVPSGELMLAIERPDTFKVAINGAPVSMDAECGWWCDRSLRKIPLEAAGLRIGQNQVVLICDYDENHPGLETVYLLGNFAVQVKSTEAVMTKMPTSLRVGDWVTQGLPFYSGSVAYRYTIRAKLRKKERLFVQVPKYRGAAVRVLAGGQVAGIIAWEPNEVEITDLIGNGPLDLRIEVIGHRRNSHGPLHLAEKWPSFLGPGQFVSSGDKWIDAYQLVPCGLMAAPKLVVRR